MNTLSKIHCTGHWLLITVLLTILLSGCDSSSTSNSESGPSLAAPKILDIANETFVQNVAIQELSFNNAGGGKLSQCTTESLPTGLVVSVFKDESTCVISGVPRLVEPTATYEVTARNATGSNRASVTISVERQKPDLENLELQTYTINSPIETTRFSNLGGDHLISCEAQVLPFGITLSVSSDGSTCELSGTPSHYQSEAYFPVTAENESGSSTATFGIQVIPPLPSLITMAMQTLAQGEGPVNLRFENQGGGRLTSCTALSLPAGLDIGVSADGDTCEITGVPEAEHLGNVFVTVFNEAGRDDATVRIQVLPEPPVMAAVPSQVFTLGEGVSLTVGNSGGHLEGCSAESLPGGLEVRVTEDGTSCEVYGVASQLQENLVHTVTAFNDGGSDSTAIEIAVYPMPPELQNMGLQTFERAETVSVLALSNLGGGSLTACQSDTLPEGLSLSISSDGNTCEVSGYPASLQERTTHTITAVNAAGNSSATVDIEILARAFVTRWDMPASNDESSLQLVIPTEGEGYNYSVDWGDGTNDTDITGDAIHTYALPGTYTVAIRGDFPRVLACRDNLKLSSIEQWGDIQWQSMRQAFRGCRHLIVNASDAPDLSQVTDMHGMFDMNPNTGSDVSEWDVSIEFRHSLANWDVSNVTDMSKLFHCSVSFNQDISSWDVSSVTNMSLMFYFTAFDQDISGWDVSSVRNMMGLFYGTPFNQDIGQWDVSSVEDMGFLFGENKLFNQDLSQWDVSSVEDMYGTFAYAYAFNQPLERWDVSSVESMTGMFYRAKSFNQPIGSWDVSAVTSMTWMFYDAFAFNQPIGSWDVSSVTSMYGMFWRASVFDQDISTWNITSVTDMEHMLYLVTLSVENYSALLSGWSVQNVQHGVVFDAGGSTYSSAYEGARTTLTDSFDWTITDGGVAP